MSVNGLTVQFTNNSSGSGLTYLWDFGDGSGKTSSHPSHTYQAPGQYSVTLTVTDSLGRTDMRTKQVTVNNPTPPPTQKPTPTPTDVPPTQPPASPAQ